MLIGCAGSPDPGNQPPPGQECQLDTKGEKTQGYPFDVAKFTSAVAPVLLQSCGSSGCHGAPSTLGNFTIYPKAAQGASSGGCDFANSFNSTAKKIDLTTPANSKLIAKVNGNSAIPHFAFAADSPALKTLVDYVDAAVATLAADGGGTVTPGPGDSPFDYAVFQRDIQPAINTANCAQQGCHLTGANGFFLKANPAANSADMEFNFKGVTARASLDDPASSQILFRATNAHASGASTQISADAKTKFLAWITAAKTANGGNNGGGQAPGCVPASSFNVGVFQSEIRPIIDGLVDLNEADQVGRGAGCTSTQCHGADRGPGTLNMSRDRDAAQVLESFGCFVNLTAPSESEIVLCPLDQFGCRKAQHPGQDIFRDGADKNYQRFLAFIYGAKSAVSPHDLAFFARKINVIFDDPQAVLNGQTGQTCATTAGCHGISAVGQSPPNGSDFPIIQNAGSNIDALKINFFSATGFVSFLNPNESSLFTYPTNKIQELTGLAHPGGPDFAENSQQALDILTWANGLRPDAQGFVNNWLVLGDFFANQITDRPVDEASLNPEILNVQGGGFNLGAWDGLFSDNANVDLTKLFINNGTNRIAYAATALINAQGFPQRVQLVVSSPNALQVFVDGRLTQQAGPNSTTNVFLDMEATGAKRTAKIMLKLFQSAQQNQLQFTAQLRNDQDQVLNNVNSQFVFTLGSSGGI